jgi:hypothetical protein
MKRKNTCPKYLIICFVLFIFSRTNAQTVILQENFTGNVLPPGWYEDSSGVPAVIHNWRFTGQPNGITGTGFDNSYLRANYATHEYSLVTNSLDASALNSVYLSFSEFYAGPSTINSYMKIEITKDGGQNWIEVFNNLVYNHQGVNLIGFRKVINISSLVVNESNFKIRFRYLPSNSYWAIDSVVVSDNEPCTSPTDSSGVTTNDRNFLCDGSFTNLKIESLSRGVGQTYQWQMKSYPNGTSFSNVSGATADTLVTAQSGSTYYQCLLTCNGSTATTKPVFVADSPVVATYLKSLGKFGICNGTNDTIYLVQDNHYNDITYQWAQNDSAQAVYNDIPGATDTAYIVSAANFSTDKFFICKQVCSTSGKYRRPQFAIGEFVNENPYCYCIPYNVNNCQDSIWFYNGGIVDVSVSGTTLANPSPTCNNTMGLESGFNNFNYFPPSVSNCTATITPGSAYTINVTTDTLGTFLICLWVDYNRNGYFETSESRFISHWALPGSTSSLAFTVPLNATPGLTGLRVRACNNFPFFDSTMACGYNYGGETEDYMVTIDSTTSVKNFEKENGAFKLFPNPVLKSSLVSIMYYEKNESVKTIEVFSPKGNTVYRDFFTGSNFSFPANFESGVYFVKLLAANACYYKTIIVIN